MDHGAGSISNLESFPDPVDALVVGANGGLGRAFVDALIQCGNVRTVHAWSRRASLHRGQKLASRIVDVDDEAQLKAAVGGIDRLSLVVVATGVLHNDNGLGPEKTWRSIEPGHMAETFRVNAILPLLIAKHTLPLFPRKERALFCCLSARVGSISDNRLGGWYSYRASKAALNQSIRCLSIELRRTHPQAICIGMHPGTVDTALSRPFHKTLSAAHRLFAPKEAVGHMLRVVDGVTPDDSGSILAWDGSLIAP